MSTLRLFIAVPCRPTPGLRAVLSAMQAQRDVFKPVSAEQLHVTLRFLGEQPTSRVSALAEAMQRAVTAARVSAMALDFAGLMTLPPGNRKPPRTVCVGFDDAGPLHALHDALLRELAELDPSLAEVTRPYRPHLTLGRVKLPRNQTDRAVSRARELVAKHAQTAFGQFAANELRLIASELTPTGPVHRTLHRIALPSAQSSA